MTDPFPYIWFLLGKNWPKNNGGEEGIRTLDALLTHTPLAGERLRPLGHLSINGDIEGANFFKRETPRNLGLLYWEFR